MDTRVDQFPQLCHTPQYHPSVAGLSMPDTNHIVPAPPLEAHPSRLGILYETSFLCCFNVFEAVFKFASIHSIDVSELCSDLDTLVHYSAVPLPEGAFTHVGTRGRKRRRRRKRVVTSASDTHITQVSKPETFMPAPNIETLAPYAVASSGSPTSIDLETSRPIQDPIIRLSSGNTAIATGSHFAALSGSASDDDDESASHSGSYVDLPPTSVVVMPVRSANVANESPTRTQESCLESMLDNTIENIGPGTTDIVRPKRRWRESQSNASCPISASSSFGPTGHGKGRSSAMIGFAWLPVYDSFGNQLLTHLGNDTFIATKPAQAGNSPGLACRSQRNLSCLDEAGRFLQWSSSITGTLHDSWLLIHISDLDASLP